MQQLQDIRKQIDEQDKLLCAAFAARMELCALAAETKQAQFLPLYDGQREANILSFAEHSVPAPLSPYARKLFETLLQLSRDYQKEHIAACDLGC